MACTAAFRSSSGWNGDPVDLLKKESEPAVRAVLAHWLIGYVHPYPDGNGRMARFLMNAMFASGGFPWVVVRVEDRST
jgi:Fic family protein